MSTETLEHKGNNYRKRIVECPFCGKEIGDGNSGSKLRNHLPCDEVDA